MIDALDMRYLVDGGDADTVVVLHLCLSEEIELKYYLKPINCASCAHKDIAKCSDCSQVLS
jgi:hypothetical protein